MKTNAKPAKDRSVPAVDPAGARTAHDRDRRDLLELLFRDATDAVFLAGPDGRILDVNPAACTVSGYAREELLGTRLWALLTSPSGEDVVKFVRERVQGEPVTLPCTCRRKTGELTMLDVRITRLGFPGRDLLVAFGRDLPGQTQPENGPYGSDERRRTKEELRRLNAELSQQAARLRQVSQMLLDSEQRLRLVIEMGKIGLWVWNSTDVKNFGDWSNRLKEIFGLPLGPDVTHEAFMKCLHPEDRERVDRCVMQALGGVNGGEYRAEYRIIHPHDGSERWVTARGQAFFNAEGKAIRFIGAVMDITELKRAEALSSRLNLELERRIAERTTDLAQTNQALTLEIDKRKQAEEALKRSEDHLRLAIDSIPGLVWSGLPDGSIDYLNKRWTDYTGLTVEQASGWGWQAAIHPEDLPGLLRHWESILAAGVPGEFEARLRRFDGEYRHFLFRGVPLRDGAGKVVKWYGINTDVEALRTSQHLARGQLEALTHTLSALSQESMPEKFLEHVLRMVGRQLGAHSLGVWEMDRDTGRVELAAAFESDRLYLAEEEEMRTSPQSGIATQDHPVWREFFRSGEHCVIGELDADPPRVRIAEGPHTPWHEWFGDDDAGCNFPTLVKRLLALGIVSTLGVPLLVGGKVTGLISVRFRQKRAFRCEELELARALAHQAMLAIQLMRLSRQSRRAAVVAERNRLARDIHDTLAQGLTGVIVQLEAAEDAQAQNLAEAAAAHLERASERARESLREARRSVHALRPLALEGKSLCAALEELVGKMTVGTNLRAECTVEGQPRPLPQGGEENLLRIGQEVITNTLRHARADRFKVDLGFEVQTIRLALRDDGIGFDPATRHDGFGLLGIKERVEAMGGTLRVQSAPEKGTAISVVLPLVDPPPPFPP